MKKLTVIALTLLLLLSICACGSSWSGSTNSGLHSDAEAFAVAETIVKTQLKSPGTAKFCWVTDATITHVGDDYTVKGWVDAQNSFGATLRSNFTVTYTAIRKGNDIGYKNPIVTFD